MVMKVFVIIPAYNEEKHISDVIQKTKIYASDIVVVDDGSRDNTYTTAKKTGVVTLRHVVNLGKGASLKTGCDYAYKHKADIIIAMDADGQHNPELIPKFVSAIQGHDVVFGYRKRDKSMPAVLRFGNWFINKATQILYNIELHDTQCGYRAFRANVYKYIRWRALDYFVESEMIANIGKHKLRYTQLPIQTIYSDKYKGTTVIDGCKIIFNMILWRFRK